MEDKSNIKIKFEDISHFFLINSKTINQNQNPWSKIGLVHFFFLYADKYKKQHYYDFAFALIQETLLNFINVKQKFNNVNLDFIHIGHGLMELDRNNFFTTDNINEILYPFDRLAIHKTELYLSQNEDLPQYNLQNLLTLASYLLCRMNYINGMSNHSFALKENLISIFLELIKWSDRLVQKYPNPKILFAEFLLTKGLNQKETANIAQKGLLKLRSQMFVDKEKILTLYKLARDKHDIDKALLLTLYFSEKVEELTYDRERLEKDIEEKIFHDIEKLYNNASNNSSHDFQRIIIYAITLLEKVNPRSLNFLVQPITKLLLN